MVIPCQGPNLNKKTLVIPWGESAETPGITTKKTLQIPAVPKETMVIKGPSLTPYENNKAVPWSYDSAVYINGLKQENEPLSSQGPAISNIAGTWGMTRSGRVFGSEPPKKKDATSIKDKGKAVVETSQEKEPPSKNITDQEEEEFMKIIKRSNYRVVDQLHQTPAKISILSLLINSEAHRIL